MRIRLLLFAAHKEVLGRREMALDVPEGTTAEDLYSLVSAGQPKMDDLRGSTTFAVNREVVPSTTPLHGEDEVAFLQPVSGGSSD